MYEKVWKSWRKHGTSSHHLTSLQRVSPTSFQLLIAWRVWSNCPILVDCASHLNTYFSPESFMKKHAKYKHITMSPSIHTVVRPSQVNGHVFGIFLNRNDTCFPTLLLFPAYPMICWENPSNLTPYLYFGGFMKVTCNFFDFRSSQNISGLCSLHVPFLLQKRR